jgi:hypothetical protein
MDGFDPFELFSFTTNDIENANLTGFTEPRDLVYEKNSIKSNTSSIAIQKRAQAEAAKTKLLYANKLAELRRLEIELEESAERRKDLFEQELAQRRAVLREEEFKENKRKSDLHSSLELLKIQQEIAAAEAEAKVYECEETNSQDLGLPRIQTNEIINNFIKLLYMKVKLQLTT